MTFEILMPHPSSRPKTVKDAVISTLTAQWPLTLKGIYHKIKGQYALTVTYQAVYKAVKELKEKEVLTEKNKGYMINVRWIKQVQSFTDMVETNYYMKSKLGSFTGLRDTKKAEDIVILCFNNLFDAEKYLYYFMKHELFKLKNEIICEQISFLWKPNFYLRAEYNYYKRMMQLGHKFYFCYTGKFKAEEELARFYRDIGIKVRSTKRQYPIDVIALHDFFIQVYTPDDIKKGMAKYVAKKDKLALLERVLSKDTTIKVIISKDKELAEQTRRQVLRGFGKG